MPSIVIAAHNEESTIDRCLRHLLKDALPDEFEVVVVCNGCTDRTYSIASTHAGVKVIQTPTASKPMALNLGDGIAESYPRLYVDADVLLSTNDARTVLNRLSRGDVHAAAPSLHLDLSRSPWIVRTYYKVWMKLPYAKAELVGVGVYGNSDHGFRQRGAFPTPGADDLWASRLFGVTTRKALAEAKFVAFGEATTGALIRAKTRTRSNRLFMARLYNGQPGIVRNGGKEFAALLVKQPSLALAMAIYFGVTAITVVRARWRLLRKDSSWQVERSISYQTEDSTN